MTLHEQVPIANNLKDFFFFSTKVKQERDLENSCSLSVLVPLVTRYQKCFCLFTSTILLFVDTNVILKCKHGGETHST
jgi:hypothetical protein